MSDEQILVPFKHVVWRNERKYVPDDRGTFKETLDQKIFVFDHVKVPNGTGTNNLNRYDRYDGSPEKSVQLHDCDFDLLVTIQTILNTMNADEKLKGTGCKYSLFSTKLGNNDPKGQNSGSMVVKLENFKRASTRFTEDGKKAASSRDNRKGLVVRNNNCSDTEDYSD